MMPLWRKWTVDELRQAQAEIEAELSRRKAKPRPLAPAGPVTDASLLSKRLRFMAAITASGEFTSVEHLSMKLLDAAIDAEELEKHTAALDKS